MMHLCSRKGGEEEEEEDNNDKEDDEDEDDASMFQKGERGGGQQRRGGGRCIYVPERGERRRRRRTTTTRTMHLCSRKGREEVDHFLIFDARLNKLLPGHFAIRVGVHLVKDPLCPVLRALLISNYSRRLFGPHH